MGSLIGSERETKQDRPPGSRSSPLWREGRACQAGLSEILSSQAFCFVVVVKSLLVFFVVFCFLKLASVASANLRLGGTVRKRALEKTSFAERPKGKRTPLLGASFFLLQQERSELSRRDKCQLAKFEWRKRLRAMVLEQGWGDEKRGRSKKGGTRTP